MFLLVGTTAQVTLPEPWLPLPISSGYLGIGVLAADQTSRNGPGGELT